MSSGLKILLFPFSFLYGLVTLFRNRLYDWHFLKEKKFAIHSIGVGNLAVGGAGKTPLVEYLIRLLLAHDFKVATLSRGYKRKTKGYLLADQHSTADDIGDEPLLYKVKYPIQVAVDAIRTRGMENLLNLQKDKPSVVLLDDVFQHRSIKCGMNIVVTDYNNLYFNDTMLPSGTLREYKSGIVRADVIVVTKTPERLSAVEIRTILKDVAPRAHQRVFFSYLKYGELYAINDPEDRIDTLNELYRYKVVSFAGIANAEPMVNYLSEYAEEVRHLPFTDHYEFGEMDLENLQKYYDGLSGANKIMVTTEKDLMRLKAKPIWEKAKLLKIYILPVEVSFKDKETEFNELILKYVRTNTIYHQKYT